MSNIDIEICRCNCHNNFGPRTSHNFPCCNCCEYCHKNIHPHYYDEHIGVCKKKFEDTDTDKIDLKNLTDEDITLP